MGVEQFKSFEKASENLSYKFHDEIYHDRQDRTGPSIQPKSASEPSFLNFNDPYKSDKLQPKPGDAPSKEPLSDPSSHPAPPKESAKPPESNGTKPESIHLSGAGCSFTVKPGREGTEIHVKPPKNGSNCNVQLGH
jgi:hypothetical protein